MPIVVKKKIQMRLKQILLWFDKSIWFPWKTILSWWCTRKIVLLKITVFARCKVDAHIVLFWSQSNCKQGWVPFLLLTGPSWVWFVLFHCLQLSGSLLVPVVILNFLFHVFTLMHVSCFWSLCFDVCVWNVWHGVEHCAVHMCCGLVKILLCTECPVATFFLASSVLANWHCFQLSTLLVF